MEANSKQSNKTIYILLGIGAGIGVFYFLCNRWKNKQEQNIVK
jgi:hypothetical protein